MTVITTVAKAKIKKSKDFLLEGLNLMPKHNHRDPATTRDCTMCGARKAFTNAYISLPSNKDIGYE